jgi:hypothetical protein
MARYTVLVTRVTVDEVDERVVVQVVFTPNGSKYAYAVPDELSVRIGDAVVTPAGFSNRKGVATVVYLGRGGYTGPLKALVGKVVTQDDREYPDRGFGICPDCGIGYTSAESAPCGGVMS